MTVSNGNVPNESIEKLKNKFNSLSTDFDDGW